MLTSIGRYINDVITEDGRLYTDPVTESGDIKADPPPSRVLSGFVYIPIEAGGHVWHGSEEPGHILISLEAGGALAVTTLASGGGLLSINGGGSLSSPNPISGGLLVSLEGGGNLSSPNGVAGNVLVSLSAGGNMAVVSSLYGGASITISGGGSVSIPGLFTGHALLSIEGGGTLQLIQVSPPQPVTDDVVTWSLNTATGGHSTYTNYGFNSFVRIGNDYYGFSGAGIFRLDGETDDGTRIDWQVKTGISTFGTFKLKYIHDARVTMRADGDIAMREIVDEQTDRSQAIIYSDERYGIHARRVKLPKGIKGTSWQFEVYGEKTNADIKELSVEPLASQRTQ